jgi:hypothetical protein
VDKKNIVELAAELTRFSQKARDKKLTPDDMQGGTFTITSLGGIGGTGFSPIVNYPEVAILGLSRSSMVPLWMEGKFEPRRVLPEVLRGWSYQRCVLLEHEFAVTGTELYRKLEGSHSAVKRSSRGSARRPQGHCPFQRRRCWKSRVRSCGGRRGERGIIPSPRPVRIAVGVSEFYTRS